MAEFKVIEGGAAAKAKAGPAVRAGLMLLALEHFGGFIFGSTWALFARPNVEAMFASLPAPQANALASQLMNLSIFPLSLAIVAVVAPLFGWWIYSRIPEDKQTSTGWSIAAIYTAGDVLITMLLAAGKLRDAIEWGAMGFILVFGALISVLWAMLFMGCGFLIAKLFKSKL
jgi:hypothetical protein